MSIGINPDHYPYLEAKCRKRESIISSEKLINMAFKDMILVRIFFTLLGINPPYGCEIIYQFHPSTDILLNYDHNIM